jgi:hypothetical protein
LEKDMKKIKKATKSTKRHNLHIPGPQISDKDGLPMKSHKDPVNKHG